jgi:glycosyltransferase involved in cell wall biosynthesis
VTGAVTPRADGALSARVLPPRRRRIVILTEDSKPWTGGVAEYLHQLALATSATHEVVIVTSVRGAEALNPGLPFRYREVAWYRSQHRWFGDGFMPLRRINTVAWLLTQRRRVRSRLAAIHAEQPDSSYVFGRLSSVTGPWSVACSDLGLPYAAIGHGFELVERLSALGQRRRAARVTGAAHWFANSHATADTLALYGVPPGRCSLLLPGVTDAIDAAPSEADRWAVRERLGLGARRFLLSLCRLHYRKGIDIGIEAFAQVANEYPDLAYVVVGSGPEHDALTALARGLGVGDRVVFAGAIDDVATKAVLYAECEFFVLPVRAIAQDVEGFGIVFLEASLCGKAVIGGASGGVPEAVADGVSGLLVDTRDATALREAERRLLRDPAYAALLGRQGRARAQSEFSWSDRGQVFGAQLDALAGRAPVPSVARARPTTPVVRSGPDGE